MDMLRGEQIAAADLTDWRKLAQALHARYLVDDFYSGARFVAAVGEAGDAAGHHPHASIGDGYVDLRLVSDDAIYRDDEGTEHVIEWVTQQDVDLARRITAIAREHGVDADPASVSHIELGLDTARSATIAPVWAALLTGSAEAQGRGTPSDEIRDATGRVPNLWFGDADERETPRQRFHVEVYVAPEVLERRIAAALAAGGTVVDDSDAPSLTVIADQDGNEGIVCVDASAAREREPPPRTNRGRARDSRVSSGAARRRTVRTRPPVRFVWNCPTSLRSRRPRAVGSPRLRAGPDGGAAPRGSRPRCRVTCDAAVWAGCWP